MSPKKKEAITAADFTDLIKRVSVESFNRMVRSADLTPADARALCEAFKEFRK